MKKLLLSLVGMALVVAPAFAVNLPFNLAGTNAQSLLGGSLAFTVSGVTATVTAWSATSGGALTAGYVGEYSGNGLGVCNNISSGEIEGGTLAAPTACGSPEHQVDNANRFDFLLFKFSTAVSLDSIFLQNFGGTNDMDLTYWTRTNSSALDLSQSALSQASLTSAGFGSQNNVLFTASGTNPTVTDPLSGNNVSYLLVGAYFGSGDATADYFKIDTLNVHTPEPATFGTLGLALAGLGLTAIQRRRRASKS